MGTETRMHKQVQGGRDTLVQQGCRGSKQVQMLFCECGLQSAAYSGRRGMGEGQGESHRSQRVHRCRVWGMRARLLPNRNLLLADWLDLRENAQHITCLFRWSDLRSVALYGPNREGRVVNACIISISRWASRWSSRWTSRWASRWASPPSAGKESRLRGCSGGCTGR